MVERSVGQPRPRALPFVLAAAILGISVSGPLARLANAEPLAIAVWRLAISCGLIAVMLTATGTWREWRGLTRRELLLAAAAGLFLAVHFWSWIASLGMTSVAASVLLVNLHPVVIVAGSALWLGERPSRRQLLGIGLALVGAAVIAFGDSALARDVVAGAEAAPSLGADAARSPSSVLRGNLLALLGAVMVGLYYLTGRSLRQKLSLWPYVGLVYGACLLALLAFAAGQGTHLAPFAAREWLLFAAIALGPMMVGHTGFNWSLRYVPAFVVSLAVLAEPVGAALLASIIPAIAEVPGPWVILGGVVVLLGLALGTPRR